MTVRVRDRSAESSWGSGLTNPVVRTVTISAYCPRCVERRGTPSNLNQCDDGAYYSVDVWKNPCGHVDAYAAVVKEAKEFAAVVAAGVTFDPLGVYQTDEDDDGITIVYRLAVGPGEPACPTCHGAREIEYVGEAHEGFNEPNYFDTCPYCGGTGEDLPVVVRQMPPDLELPDGWHWATRPELDEYNAEREATTAGEAR
jgi:hypothetical protein